MQVVHAVILGGVYYSGSALLGRLQNEKLRRALVGSEGKDAGWAAGVGREASGSLYPAPGSLESELGLDWW